MEYLFRKVDKNISISPSKMLLITEMIRRKEFFSSLNYLKNSPQKSSRIIFKILNSTYKQFAYNNKNDEDFLKKKIYIEKIEVGRGIIRKKLFIRAKGRSDRIRKRKSHVTISLIAR